jgi:chromosome segregation ATPase
MIQEGRDEKWLQEALRPYALENELAPRLKELEEQFKSQAHQLVERIAREVEEVKRLAKGRHDEFLEACATQAVLFQQLESEQAARNQLAQALDAQSTELRGQVATQFATDEALKAHFAVNTSLTDSLRQSLAEVQSQAQGLQGTSSTVSKQLETITETLEVLQSRVQNEEHVITRVQQEQLKMREERADDRMRASSILAQQQHNRTEMNHCIKRAQEIDALRIEVKGCKTAAESHGGALEAMQKEMVQWDEAVAAQKGLRADAAKMQKEVAILRTTVAAMEKQQQADTASLRAMHTSLLQG